MSEASLDSLQREILMRFDRLDKEIDGIKDKVDMHLTKHNELKLEVASMKARVDGHSRFLTWVGTTLGGVITLILGAFGLQMLDKSS